MRIETKYLKLNQKDLYVEVCLTYKHDFARRGYYGSVVILKREDRGNGLCLESVPSSLLGASNGSFVLESKRRSASAAAEAKRLWSEQQWAFIAEVLARTGMAVVQEEEEASAA